jgi:hypothetical protein
MVALLSRAILMNCQRLGNSGLPQRKERVLHQRPQRRRIGSSAGFERVGDQLCDRPRVAAEFSQHAAGLDVFPAAAAMAQRVAVALGRARTFAVAAIGSANGNIIVRRFGRENAPPAADDRMFARCRIFHDDSICALCGCLISDHT